MYSEITEILTDITAKGDTAPKNFGNTKTISSFLSSTPHDIPSDKRLCPLGPSTSATVKMILVQNAEVALEDSASAQGCRPVHGAVVSEAVVAGVVAAPQRPTGHFHLALMLDHRHMVASKAGR